MKSKMIRRTLKFVPMVAVILLVIVKSSQRNQPIGDERKAGSQSHLSIIREAPKAHLTADEQRKLTLMKYLHKESYAWAHGAISSNDGYGFLGYGPLYRIFAYLQRPKVCVIIGTGAGFTPSLVRQGQIDSGFRDGVTYLVDLGANMGAMPHKVHNTSSPFRLAYPEIEVLNMPSVPDGLRYFKERNITIDYLHIDGDHTFAGAASDFYEYVELMAPLWIITLHDTNMDYGCERLIPILEADPAYQVIDFSSFETGENLGGRRYGTGMTVVLPSKRRKSGLHIRQADQVIPISRTCDVVEGTYNWSYLHLNSGLSSRQFLISGILRLNNIRTVLEVGSYCTPLCRYSDIPFYTAIEPNINSYSGVCGSTAKMTHINKGIQDVTANDLTDVFQARFALVLLGIDDYELDHDIVRETIGKARFIFIEGSTYNPLAVERMNQLIKLITSTGHQVMFDINIDINEPSDDMTPHSHNRNLKFFSKR